MTNEGLRLNLPGRPRLQRKPYYSPGPALILCAVLLTALLFLLPPARSGLAALLNRLMDASEAVNAYAYRRYPVTTAPDSCLPGRRSACAAR